MSKRGNVSLYNGRITKTYTPQGLQANDNDQEWPAPIMVLVSQSHGVKM